MHYKYRDKHKLCRCGGPGRNDQLIKNSRIYCIVTCGHVSFVRIHGGDFQIFASNERYKSTAVSFLHKFGWVLSY